MEDTQRLLLNAAHFTANKGIAKFTRFLDPAQVVQAQQIARQEGVRFLSWGGYENAERSVGCFYQDEAPDRAEFPLVCLQSTYPSRFSSINHRDLLGAFMSLGLTRDTLGDIIILDDVVYLFVTSGTADFVAGGLTSAGRASLEFRYLESMPDIPAPEGREFSSVISSMRLDAVLAAAYRLSRSAAADAIRAGLVKVDHVPCERVDMMLGENTLLSLRGEGRVRLLSIKGMTKKQRIGVTFFRYE